MPNTLTKIEVTQEHINNGKKSNARLCPIALAIAMKVKPRVTVRAQNEYFSINRYVGDLPPTVRDFIKSFDLTLLARKLDPFEFYINLPDEVLRDKQ